GFDFFPTFCEWAGISARKLPQGIEGGSIVSLLANPKQIQVKRPREELVFHFPHYQTADGPHSAIMLGNLKLLKFYEDNRLALYDLSKDIGEQDDLSQRLPQQADQLHQRLNRYLAAVGAQLPVVNPGYDPSRPPTLPQKGKRGQGNRAGRPRR
ncbi:MAG: sulfatase/phosphatase domain-containing protein, partial [Pirellulaceae bacterium]